MPKSVHACTAFFSLGASCIVHEDFLLSCMGVGHGPCTTNIALHSPCTGMSILYMCKLRARAPCIAFFFVNVHRGYNVVVDRG